MDNSSDADTRVFLGSGIYYRYGLLRVYLLLLKIEHQASGVLCIGAGCILPGPPGRDPLPKGISTNQNAFAVICTVSSFHHNSQRATFC